jgi:lipoprotein-releasing system ATP-binding protein
MSEAVLSLRGVTRVFDQGGSTLSVLRGVDLDLYPGELVALVGPSGTGKSTLLHLAGLLEPASSGSIRIAGTDTASASESKRTGLRRSTIGFVYQFHHLLPEFSALENIVLPQMISGVSRGTAVGRGRELLQRVGLAGRADHRPGQLSGGEQQRVAIARALANHPKILLADEPTGNLDGGTAESVFSLLMELVRDQGLAALIATHNPDLAQRMDRIVELRDGTLGEHVHEH